MSGLLTSGLVALIAGIIIGPLLIPMLRRLKFGQTVRSDGPQTHLIKTGTPTMGGILIWSALLVSLAWHHQLAAELLPFLVVIVGHALLGFADDYIKAVHKDPGGLAAKTKLIGQFLLAALFYWGMLRGGITDIAIPYTGFSIPLGPLYPLFTMVYMVFFSNAVNFADGIDGLCGGLTLIYSTLVLALAWRSGDSSLGLLASSLIGSLLAFLAFNLHPARLFMGDTGSLGLGAALAGMALLLHQEIALVGAGILFLLEILSVILQVSWFKYTRRKYGAGRRIFRMAPFHHHFELLGWSEWRVVSLFWSVALFAAVITYLFI